jgi:uncharacterized protein YndB with AHSA1/START domain
MPDRIERELHVKAAVERVWQVITQPEYVRRWLGDKAEIDLRPGGAALFGWNEYGDGHAVVERVEPPRVFAFRWARDPGVPMGPDTVSTLVEFTLSPDGDGTLVRLVESGFADEAHRDDHSGGWDAELADLAALLEAEPA